ncbi:hypothetical protein DL768_007364 [Monosporascus sp. mg162]|nr:hypothetical protein DL768_007364 [Monosporascus sp. mg162]
MMQRWGSEISLSPWDWGPHRSSNSRVGFIEDSDSEAELEAEMVQLQLRKGKEELQCGNSKSAETFLKPGILRLRAHRSRYLDAERKLAMLQELMDTYQQHKSCRYLGENLQLVELLLKLHESGEARIYARKCGKGYRKLGSEGQTGLKSSLALKVAACKLDGDEAEAQLYEAMLANLPNDGQEAQKSGESDNPIPQGRITSCPIGDRDGHEPREGETKPQQSLLRESVSFKLTPRGNQEPNPSFHMLGLRHELAYTPIDEPPTSDRPVIVQGNILDDVPRNRASQSDNDSVALQNFTEKGFEREYHRCIPPESEVSSVDTLQSTENTAGVITLSDWIYYMIGLSCKEGLSPTEDSARHCEEPAIDRGDILLTLNGLERTKSARGSIESPQFPRTLRTSSAKPECLANQQDRTTLFGYQPQSSDVIDMTPSIAIEP